MASTPRYIDLAISIRIGDVERDDKGKPRWKVGGDVELLKVGGCFDRKKRKWLTPAERKERRSGKKLRKLVMRFHRGQEESIAWFCVWLKRYLTNDWEGVERVWSAMLIGGRRSGKTHVCCAVLIIFAVVMPGAIIWAISPTLETGDELDQAFRELLPRGWYQRRQAKTGRATTYLIANGNRGWRRCSRILLKSAVNPDRLKAGRVDLALINEAQEMAFKAYIKLRGAIADKGGLLLLAANPPDKPIGQWVEKMYFAIQAKKVDAVSFVLNPKDNPLIVFASLLSMAKEVDEDDLAREVYGIFRAIGDVVFKNWSDDENIRYPPADWKDVTAAASKRALGHAASNLVGQDFQKIPAMIGIVHRVFLDPKTGEECLWVVDEAIADDTDENGLLDVLENMPVWRPGDAGPETRTHDEYYRGWVEVDDKPDAPKHCACIIDASGFFQDGAHNQGKTSDRYLKARRWTHLFKPQKDSDKNPAIAERMKSGRALIKNAEGYRRLFVAPHCTRTAEALRKYENKLGVPNRRSQWAHPVDGVTYVTYRLYGRPKVKTGLEYRSAGKREERGEGW